MNLIGRYIFREAFGSWLAVMAVLFLIFMTNQLADILGDAAADRLPREAVLAIFGPTPLRYLTLLMPITLFLGVTLALARLNRDGEMAALSACGVGAGRRRRRRASVGDRAGAGAPRDPGSSRAWTPRRSGRPRGSCRR